MSKRLTARPWYTLYEEVFSVKWNIFKLNVFTINIIPQIQIVQPRDNAIFHCISLNPTRTACAIEYILYFMATRVCPA